MNVRNLSIDFSAQYTYVSVCKLRSTTLRMWIQCSEYWICFDEKKFIASIHYRRQCSVYIFNFKFQLQWLVFRKEMTQTDEKYLFPVSRWKWLFGTRKNYEKHWVRKKFVRSVVIRMDSITAYFSGQHYMGEWHVLCYFPK